jgi:polygalacturonase
MVLGQMVLGVAAALWLALSPPANAVEAPAKVDWSLPAKIVAEIQAPQIPDRQYLVTDFGAVGDGKTDARPGILAAIAKASKDGGGRVVLPAGTWFSKGPIVLKSRIDLHVAEGATLLFSPVAADYLPAVKTRWEGTEVMSYSPLVYAPDVEDVAITGTGVIDGNGASEFFTWIRKAKPDYERLRRMGFDGVPLKDRVFAEGTHLRPSIIQFLGAKRVKLEGYTVKNSPFWVNHLVYTGHVTVRNIKVDSMHANNDGVDVDSSSYVLIEKNDFHTGDDSVVIKSGRDRDGRDIGVPSRFVVVRDNEMRGEDGIALGSEMSGGISHVYFENNRLSDGAAAIRFKANLDRGGTVEHIGVRNFDVASFDTLFWFQLNYPGELGGNFPSTYRDIVFEDFRVKNVGTFFEAHAPAQAPLRGVTIRNVSVESIKKDFVLENVEGLRLENVTVAGKPLTLPK